MHDSQIYSVSDINRAIKQILEETFPLLWIEGEISNFKAHYSGHYYFSLKDENAQISAVIWKSRLYNIPYEIEDGMLIRAFGNIRVYEKSGRYQLDIIRIEPAGVGKLQIEFEKLKQRLSAEGLFDSEYKKPLPKYPKTIGIVTSSTGAAVKDIIHVLNRRAPNVKIIVRSTQVQGNAAAKDISKAIEEFNQYKKVDILIVGRGGGSLEDLWPFNEESVARTIYKSAIPVISAVGHEIDFTISDFVADMRAPTPSAAAEMAVPDYFEVQKDINYLFNRIHAIIQNKLIYYRERVLSLKKSYGLNRPLDSLRQYAMQIDDLNINLHKKIDSLLLRKREKVNLISLRLKSLSHKSILARGYSISYINNKVIKNIESVQSGQELITELSSGKIQSTVNSVNDEEYHD